MTRVGLIYYNYNDFKKAKARAFDYAAYFRISKIKNEQR